MLQRSKAHRPPPTNTAAKTTLAFWRAVKLPQSACNCWINLDTNEKSRLRNKRPRTTGEVRSRRAGGVSRFLAALRPLPSSGCSHLNSHDFLIGIDHLVSHSQQHLERQIGALGGEHRFVHIVTFACQKILQFLV